MYSFVSKVFDSTTYKTIKKAKKGIGAVVVDERIVIDYISFFIETTSGKKGRRLSKHDFKN